MMEQTTPGFVFYRDLLQEMYTKQKFRSVLAGSIRAATEGLFAGSEIPDYLLDRVRPNELFFVATNEHDMGIQPSYCGS